MTNCMLILTIYQSIGYTPQPEGKALLLKTQFIYIIERVVIKLVPN